MPSRDVARVTIVIAATLLFLYCVYLMRHVVFLVGISAFLAVAMEPGVTFLQRVTKSRAAAVGVMILAIILFVTLFIASIAPPIVRQTNNFIDSLPELRQDLEDRTTTLGDLQRRFDITGKLDDAAQNLTGSLADLPKYFGSVLGFVADFLVILFLALYFLLHAPTMKAEGVRLLPPERRRQAAHFVDVVFTRVGGWMQGNILVSVIAGIVSFIALFAIGVPYPAALAMWVAIADLIPMVGAMLGAVVCVTVAFFAGLVPGILTTAFFLVYQQVENYLIAPRVMRRAVDVSAVAVIIAALVGGSLLGPVGVLLAVPAAASLKVIAHELWLDRELLETAASISTEGSLPEAPKLGP